MKPYLDAGFLLRLFIRSEAPVVSQLFRRCPGPIPINALQHLQVENLLVRMVRSPDAIEQRDGESGLLDWRRYHDEAVFESVGVSWEDAWITAMQWNATHPGLPPAP